MHICHLYACTAEITKISSPPQSGRGIKPQIHCWHIFVPEYHNSSKGPVPDEYREEVDKEEVVEVLQYQANEIPDLTSDDLDNSILEVTQYNVKDDADKFEDTSYCCTHRNEFGTPSNLTGKQYSTFVQQKAKDESERVILGDVSRLLNNMASSSKDNKLKKKLLAERARNQPTGGN